MAGSIAGHEPWLHPGKQGGARADDKRWLPIHPIRYNIGAMIQKITILCFVASYAVAWLVEMLHLFRPRPVHHLVGVGCGAAGFVAHTLFLIHVLYLAEPRRQLSSQFGSMLFLAWILAMFYLYGSLHHRRVAWGVFVLPLMEGLIGLAWRYQSVPDARSGIGFVNIIHAILLTLAAVGICVGFLASVMYLIQAHRLKAKALPGHGVPLLSLEHLEKMNRRAITLAFPLLTAGMLVELAPMLQSPNQLPWTDPKILATGLLWLVFATLSYLRYGHHLRGRRRHPDNYCVRLPGSRPRLATHWFGGCAVNLLVVGCSFRATPVELRERLALDEAGLVRALEEASARWDCETVALCTCNRVELYLARLDAVLPLDAALVSQFLEEFHGIPAEQIRPHLYEHRDAAAVNHLFRVAASLDSLIVGEAQIAGQVKRAYESAQQCGTAGPLLHTLFQHASVVAGRVRNETGIGHGHVSVSSAAVDYVQQVFTHFDDKTILVIGAGKMGELTLRHLRGLRPNESGC